MTADRSCQGCGYDGPGSHCHLCHQTGLPTADLLDHIRLIHPAAWAEGFERWPDGAPVVVDLTLDPQDFA